jgi:integrase
MPKLTKRYIDGVEAPERGERWIADGELKGFYLQVRPATKSFVVKYKVRGVSRSFTIGRYGPVTPEQARREAQQVIAAVHRGEDPGRQRAEKKEALSFEEVVRLYLEDAARTLKPKTHGEYKRLLDSYILPKIGRLGVADVSTVDIGKVIRALGDRKTTVNRALATLSAFYGWAAKRGHAPKGFNPAAGSEITRHREEGRERFLSGEEVERLGVALAADEDQIAAGAIRLLLLTGCRLGEILNLQWPHVDFERGLLLLPDSKTGKKAVVIGAPALAVLASFPRLGRYVIGGMSPDKPRADLKRPWARICEAAELEGVRLHDLRHSFASAGAGAGLALPVIGKLLGHSQSATTQRYTHLADDPLRKAAERVSGDIAERLGMRVGDSKEKSSVVKFERGVRGV